MKYPPLGERSWGPTFGFPRHGKGDFGEWLRDSNGRTLAIAMIETRAAVDVLDGILETPGIDAVFLGPSDFSIAWSNGGTIDPLLDGMMQTVEDVARRAISAGKSCGAARQTPRAMAMSPRGGSPSNDSTSVVKSLPRKVRFNLRMAASVLKGRKAKLRLMVAPASARNQKAAKDEGTLEILEDAGAEFLGLGCGICAGYGGNVLGENVVAISTTARNFKGRMGAASAQVYLASPYTVAATAVAGHISDPRGMIQ